MNLSSTPNFILPRKIEHMQLYSLFIIYNSVLKLKRAAEKFINYKTSCNKKSRRIECYILAEICLLILLFFSISSKSFSASNHRAKKKRWGVIEVVWRVHISLYILIPLDRGSPCSLLLLNSVLTAVKATVRLYRNLCITRYWHQTGRINIVNEV